MSKAVSNKSVAILTSLILLVMGVGYIVVQKINAPKTGEKAVMLMYDYASIEQLANNMPSLKKITTKDAYDKLTAENTEKAMNVYMKFKNEPIKVNIVKSTSNYVVYSLSTKHVAPYRKFVFFFDTNLFGKISEGQETEIYGYNFVN